jgi:hypothetical protein
MKSTLSILLILFSINAHGQGNTNPPSCEDKAICRVFDFWIGEWDVKAPNGKVAGQSLIQIALDSCLIIENWTGAGNTISTGKSFNFYNAATGFWQQTWVDNSGGVIEFIEGNFVNDAMKFASSRPFVDGSLKRLSFFKINNNQVRQFGETSADQGKTWTAEYDLMYYRK